MEEILNKINASLEELIKDKSEIENIKMKANEKSHEIKQLEEQKNLFIQYNLKKIQEEKINTARTEHNELSQQLENKMKDFNEKSASKKEKIKDNINEEIKNFTTKSNIEQINSQIEKLESSKKAYEKIASNASIGYNKIIEQINNGDLSGASKLKDLKSEKEQNEKYADKVQEEIATKKQELNKKIIDDNMHEYNDLYNLLQSIDQRFEYGFIEQSKKNIDNLLKEQTKGQSGQGQSGQGQSEQGQSGQGQSGQGQSEQGQSGQGQSGQGQSGQGQSGQGQSGQGQSEQGQSEQGQSEQGQSGQGQNKKSISMNVTEDGELQYVNCKDGKKLSVVNMPVDDLNRRKYKKLLKKFAEKHSLEKDELKRIDPYLMSIVDEKIEKDIVLLAKGLKDTLDFKVEYDFKGMEELDFRKKMLLRKIARSAEKNGFEVKNLQKGILGRIANKMKSRINGIKLLSSADTSKYLSEENPREDVADEINTSREDFKSYVSNFEHFDGYVVESEVPKGMEDKIEKIKEAKNKQVDEYKDGINDANVIDVEEYEEEK